MKFILPFYNLGVFIHQSIRVSHISEFSCRYHMQIKICYKLVVVVIYKSIYVACYRWLMDKYSQIIKDSVEKILKKLK
jgi:hypothetical protein